MSPTWTCDFLFGPSTISRLLDAYLAAARFPESFGESPSRVQQRTLRSSVVSRRCSGFISPRPL